MGEDSDLVHDFTFDPDIPGKVTTMRINRSGIKHFTFVSILSLLLTACGSGGGGSSAGSGSLSLGLTDAPVDDLYEVMVTFTDVIIHPSDGSEDIVVDVRDAVGDGMTIDLKSLGQGNSVRLLDEYPLPAGGYSWVRLVIDPDKTYAIEETGGAQLLLDCSSCDESHLKLNRSFEIGAEGVVAFTIDFDLGKSITLTRPNQKPYEDYQFKLRPTLRIIDTDVASAFIFGTVAATLTDPIVPDVCSVYVYEGDATAVEPDDNCVNDGDATACPVADRPLTTTGVEMNLESGFYDYRSGYLYPGTYTVALLCEDDLADVDDTVTFIGEATVEALSGGTEYNFEAPVAAPL
jgi:hypothetical protein